MTRPLSMTSFGRGEHESAHQKWVVEIRSVNHRFCDIKVKIPREYAPLEEKIKKRVAKAVSRGHVDIFITVTGQSTECSQLEVNMPLAREYYASLSRIQKELGLPDKPTLEMMAVNRDLISLQEETADLDAAWQSLEAALVMALEQSGAMKEREGKTLAQDLTSRLDNLEQTILNIEEKYPVLLKQKETALQDRLNKLLENIDIDPVRLAQEVAIIADKSDITEEMVRLKSHIDQFRTFLTKDEPVGRQLDFLLQEFLREINTTASKINDSETIHQTVALKNEVEKMKEQVQNIE